MFHSRQSRQEKSPFQISNYLSKDSFVFLKGSNREQILEELVDHLDRQGHLLDRDRFLQAIYERERIVSTAIGMGVALPHAKLMGYEHFFIAVGVHGQGVDWDSLDGLPVRLVFLIGGPDDQQTQYLQILSRLTLALKDEERRKKMLQMSDASDMMALFKGI